MDLSSVKQLWEGTTLITKVLGGSVLTGGLITLALFKRRGRNTPKYVYMGNL